MCDHFFLHHSRFLIKTSFININLTAPPAEYLAEQSVNQFSVGELLTLNSASVSDYIRTV